MMVFNRIIAVGIMALCMHVASTHEISTHGKLSEEAYDQSRLNKETQLLQNLGLKDTDTFPNTENPRPRTIKELISDGSRFEDNLLEGTLLRVRHHFYDPLHNRPLTVLGLAVGEKSPDWALEDSQDFNSQEFSLRHARDTFHQALKSEQDDERRKYFGKTFQTLGHVIHHLQDMAQPQHVRNDAHCDANIACGLVGQYNPSLYEKHTKDLGDNLPFTGHPPVSFDTARQFWTGQGKGIADFTKWSPA